MREGILRGIYSVSTGTAPQVQLLGSGAIMTEVLAAKELLKEEWGIEAAVWSVTSYSELHRNGIECERRSRLCADGEPDIPFISRALSTAGGPVIAATDYVRALPELIRAHVPNRYVTLGTDGFGRSDTRKALRAFFEVDAVSIVIAALKALSDEGVIARDLVIRAVRKYDRHVITDAPWVR